MIIDQYGLLINNEPGRSTRPTSQEISVIDLALSTAELGPLTLWEVPEEYPALSDHELILLRLEDIDMGLYQPNTGSCRPAFLSPPLVSSGVGTYSNCVFHLFHKRRHLHLSQSQLQVTQNDLTY